MVRPARPASWNRRNRLMNRQETVWNRNVRIRFQMDPEPGGTGTESAQPGLWPSLLVGIVANHLQVFK